MADWKAQYLVALQERDRVEKANLDLYDYCTKIADEKAELEKAARTKQASPNSEPVASPPPSVVGLGLRRVTSPAAVAESSSITQIRQDLAAAQQERSEMQTRLDTVTREFEAAKTRSRSDNKKLSQLTTNVAQLTVKLRDRDEELRGKAKLLENVQDENVTLNLQLNMAEQQSEKLKVENKELVDRWMARMGKEADQMNRDHKFG